MRHQQKDEVDSLQREWYTDSAENSFAKRIFSKNALKIFHSQSDNTNRKK